jgi:phosphatidylserine synthase 2
MVCRYFAPGSFLAVFGAVLYFGWQNVDEHPQGEEAQYDARVQNVRWALGAIAVVYLAHRVFDDKVRSMFTAFPKVWTCFSNLCYAYLYILIFIYFMNHYDARRMWGFVEERLGKPVTKDYHTYDDDCEVTFANILDNMDHYFLAHFTNWFLASMILRDSYLLHFWSLLDEILELSAQYKLPHFRECWWDHIFHDFLITNTPAIILGMKFVRLMGLQEYDWLGRKGKSSIGDWKVFNDYVRFFGILQMYFIISVNFLTGFFMINSLWIPPLSIPTLSRMYIWFLLGNLTFKEGYLVIDDRDTAKGRERYRDPSLRWVTYGIIFLEIAISFKFTHEAGNLLDDPMPDVVFYSWIVAFALMAGYYIYLRFVRDTDSEFEERASTPRKRTPRKINSAKKTN